MRDKRFVAQHRGGSLTKDQHKQLILWACKCVEHVLPLRITKVDDRLTNAIKTANAWANDAASVGEARNASLAAIAVANELINPVDIAISRAIGHAVATAHMADHALRAAAYALKAVELAGKSMESELEFQHKHLTEDIRELVLSSVFFLTSLKKGNIKSGELIICKVHQQLGAIVPVV